MGGDGGGSIRIPAALCGVFGIKATWGRISKRGDLFGGTVAHVGPLASSTLDLARCLETTSGQEIVRSRQRKLVAPWQGLLRAKRKRGDDARIRAALLWP
jgi:aspartyl-tRNA(Asn)/glutamyl-tRNA(Gln) amidotransferase subunit A